MNFTGSIDQQKTFLQDLKTTGVSKIIGQGTFQGKDVTIIRNNKSLIKGCILAFAGLNSAAGTLISALYTVNTLPLITSSLLTVPLNCAAHTYVFSRITASCFNSASYHFGFSPQNVRENEPAKNLNKKGVVIIKENDQSTLRGVLWGILGIHCLYSAGKFGTRAFNEVPLMIVNPTINPVVDALVSYLFYRMTNFAFDNSLYHLGQGPDDKAIIAESQLSLPNVKA